MTRPPGERIRCRDEVLQVMYWLHGEGLGEEPGLEELRPFLAGSVTGPLEEEVEALVSSGLLAPAGPGRYRLTPAGREEGARRFADAFRDMARPGHGVCSDPSCDCHQEGPEACQAAT